MKGIILCLLFTGVLISACNTDSSDSITPPALSDTLLVVTMDPSNDSKRVKKEISPIVSFNQDIDSTTVNSVGFMMQNFSNQAVPVFVNGTYKLNSTAKTITFDPSSDLEQGAVYRIVLTTGQGGILSKSGSALNSAPDWNFTVEKTLQIIEFFPGQNATAVTKSTPIWVEFLEKVDTTSINSSTFKLQEFSSNGYNDLQGNISYEPGGKTIFFSPSQTLKNDTLYRIILVDGESGIVSSDRNVLSASPNWSFSTVKHYPDSDNDGLYDVDEVNLYSTDPDDADTDDDGLNDYAEILAGLDPNDRNDATSDNDGSTDPLYIFQWHLNNRNQKAVGEDINSA